MSGCIFRRAPDRDRMLASFLIDRGNVRTLARASHQRVKHSTFISRGLIIHDTGSSLHLLYSLVVNRPAAALEADTSISRLGLI